MVLDILFPDSNKSPVSIPVPSINVVSLPEVMRISLRLSKATVLASILVVTVSKSAKKLLTTLNLPCASVF